MNPLTKYLRLKFGHDFDDNDVKVLCWLAHIARNPTSDLDDTFAEIVGEGFWLTSITPVAQKTLGSRGLSEVRQWLVSTGLLPEVDDPEYKAKKAQTANLRRQYFLDCILTKTVIPMLHEGAFDPQ